MLLKGSEKSLHWQHWSALIALIARKRQAKLRLSPAKRKNRGRRNAEFFHLCTIYLVLQVP